MSKLLIDLYCLISYLSCLGDVHTIVNIIMVEWEVTILAVCGNVSLDLTLVILVLIIQKILDVLT